MTLENIVKTGKKKVMHRKLANPDIKLFANNVMFG